MRTFLVEAFRIPSGSMIPTLLVGDWLFVNKASTARTSRSRASLPGYREPKRGDVVVFVSPYQADEAAQRRRSDADAREAPRRHAGRHAVHARRHSCT